MTGIDRSTIGVYYINLAHGGRGQVHMQRTYVRLMMKGKCYVRQ